MTGGRVLASCLGMLVLLAVNPAVRLPADIGSDDRLRVPAFAVGRAGRACAPTGFGWAVGAAQQAARQNPCSRPKVYVKVAFVEGVERYLNEDRGPRTNQEWLDQISQTAVEWLRASGGEGVDVIPHEEKVFVDDMPETPEPENSFSDPVPGEYVFRLYLGLADRRDVMTGVRDRTKTDYLAQAALGAADPYGTYVGAFSVENENLEKAIGGAITRLIERGLTDRIARYEATHGQTLRDPTLTASLLGPRDWVSPEPDERDARILALATDCLGRRIDGTYIYYEHTPQRGTVDPLFAADANLNRRASPYGLAVTDATASVQLKYTLQTGTEAGSVPVEIAVTGRGERWIRQVVFIKIKGLLLEVKPARDTLSPGQQTSVRVSLWKTACDAEGRPEPPEPLAGRQVRVTIEGLVDGSVAPSGTLATNDDGVATLTYTAGRSDKAVRFVATYQPRDYQEHVTGSGAVEVVPPEGDLELFLTTDASQQGECTSRQSAPPPPSTTTASFSRHLHAQVRAACTLKDQRKRDLEGEQLIRADYVCDHPMLSFTYAGTAKSVTVSTRRTTTQEWVEKMADPKRAERAANVTVWSDPVTRKVRYASWDGLDLWTTVEVVQVRTTSSGSSQTTQRLTDTDVAPFRFYPIGTVAPDFAHLFEPQRATGFDIGMLVFPTPGLPYQFGDGVKYLGGSQTGTRPPRSQNTYFARPPTCDKEASETFEIRWELSRRSER